MAEKRGTKALELWCKRMTEGYPGVKVDNMTTSWRDGLAFCAIIHHFRPELIDFSKLNKADVFYNNDLAFTVAEKYLGIPALLEPEDMVEYEVPDRLSILTYLSQFYRTFVASQGSTPARIVPKRPANSSDRGGSTSPASTSPPTKMALRSSGVPRREPCAKCGNPVYIAERLTVGKLLYHRTCFRCARCNSQLTLANYYETETPNQFCCETCPDEETPITRSLSDEEKSAGLNRLTTTAHDEYSENFESALEDSLFKPSAELGSSEYSKARSQFLSANFVDATSDNENPPELPKTKPPDITAKKATTPPPSGINTIKDVSSASIYSTPYSSRQLKNDNSVSVNVSEIKRINLKTTDNQNSISANNFEKVREVTKDKLPNDVRKDDNNSATRASPPSLVKNRMKMFEKSPDDREEKITENLKRPLADPTIVSPEKRTTRDKQESALKSPGSPRYEGVTFIKSPRIYKKETGIEEKSPNEASRPQNLILKSIKTPRSESRFETTIKKSPPAINRNDNLPLKSPLENRSFKCEKSPKIEITTGRIPLKSPSSHRVAIPEATTGLKSSITVDETRNKSSSPKGIQAQIQSKSLNFLLQKQIALKEGKISPKSLIRGTESAENLSIKDNLNLSQGKSSFNTTTIEKPKSLENLQWAKSPRHSPTTTNELAKSLLSSSNRNKNIDETKMKSFPLRKTGSASTDKIFSTGRSFVPKYQPKSLDSKIEKDVVPAIRPIAALRMKKQHSMEEFTTNLDGRKENVYRSPFQNRSIERFGHGSNSNENGARRKSFMDYTSPYRSPFISKSKFGMYTSDTELNNILSRKPDWSASSPMRSIENLYRSNSEENIRGKDAKSSSELVRVEQTRPSSVSALKNKFECLSVVESRPSTATTITTRLEKDSSADLTATTASFEEGTDDDENRSVSEISQLEESHGELLRDGHLTGSSEESPRSEIVVEISDDNAIVLDPAEAITISDDSIVEISDSSSFNRSKSERYPDDLNPFGEDDEEDESRKKIKDSLNPFDDEDDDNHGEESKPTPAVRRKIIVPLIDKSLHDGDTPDDMKTIRVQRISINPFEDDEDPQDEDVHEGERSLRPPKKVISAPRISLNPFWSDVDEDEPEEEDDESKLRPVPKPRKLRNPTATAATPEPKPRTAANQSIGGAVCFGSNSSLSSGQSGGQSVRKKKPAPRPPILVSEVKNESPNESSLTSSPSTSVSHSPRLPVKSRKTKKAPLPPTSTPYLKNVIPTEPEITDFSPILPKVPPTPTIDSLKPEDDDDESPNQEEWSNEKNVKDKFNENRRSQHFNTPNLILPPPSPTEFQEYIPNKSTYGKWKRRKGPAPSRPVPERRMITALPISEFRKELDLIELQKQGLEKQGVRLEQIIRDRCESPQEELDENSCRDEESVPIEVEDLILQLFEVVNEKNELSRREAELMYIQRQQKLEEEHAEVEYQIRCLMMQPEVNKTDSDKAKEEELIQRLVEIVERRNEIIECLEMDRLREAEEDDSISTSLNFYASRREEQSASGTFGSQKIEFEQQSDGTLSKKEKSKKPKKDKKKKKSDIIDADKDVDESESSITSTTTTKEKKKKKFALF